LHPPHRLSTASSRGSLERSHSIAIFRFFLSLFFSTRPNEFFQIQAYLITGFDSWLCYFCYSICHGEAISARMRWIAFLRSWSERKARAIAGPWDACAVAAWIKTLKSELKSLPNEDAHGNVHPIRRLYVCSFALTVSVSSLYNLGPVSGPVFWRRRRSGRHKMRASWKGHVKPPITICGPPSGHH
jgi:hypothetical protein